MLKGEKVILRAMEEGDLRRMWEFNNDLEVEVLGGGDPPYPQTYERLRAWFDENAKKGTRNGAEFAIEADGTFIGSCGLHGEDTTSRTYELGIGIGDRAYWGKGYGRDAVRVLLEYAFTMLNAHKIWLMTNGNNERAIRAYRAAGFIEEGRQRRHAWSAGAYIDNVLMGVLREEWEQSRGS